MRLFLLPILSILLLSGCATSIPQNAQTTVKNFSKPKLNVVTEAYIGDYMLDQGKATTKKYLTIENSIDGAFYNINQGSYSEMGHKNRKSWFTIYSIDGGFVTQGVFVDPPYALSMNKDEEICVSSVFVQEVKCYEGNAEIKDKTIVSDASFQQTLIYNGSVGDKINISYREFSNDRARGAFTNDVEYDMSKSKVISYRGAKIEVISYDNSSIKFKVYKHFRTNR